MKPLDALRGFGQALVGNAQSGFRKTLQRTLAGAIAGHIAATYPDPAALEEAIATGALTLQQVWATIPADGLTALRITPGVSGFATAAGKEDWRAILAWINAPPQAEGFGLPEHAAVLMQHWHWFCEQMEQAKALFLGH